MPPDDKPMPGPIRLEQSGVVATSQLSPRTCPSRNTQLIRNADLRAPGMSMTLRKHMPLQGVGQAYHMDFML